MRAESVLFLRNRQFRVSAAVVERRVDTWFVEIETERVEYDGEWWAPCIYHQGLAIAGRTGEALSGVVVQWAKPTEAGYEHPEFPFMYVFGHHDVRDSKLRFGPYQSGHIEVEWQGVCDVFWEGEFGENVPFSVYCHAQVQES